MSFADLFGYKGLVRTELSWLSCLVLEDEVETLWKISLLGGYTGLSVGRLDGFLNDWHDADLLCTGTSQQLNWPAA